MKAKPSLRSEAASLLDLARGHHRVLDLDLAAVPPRDQGTHGGSGHEGRGHALLPPQIHQDDADEGTEQRAQYTHHRQIVDTAQSLDERTLTRGNRPKEDSKSQQRHGAGVPVGAEGQAGEGLREHDDEDSPQDSQNDRRSAEYNDGSRDARLVVRSDRFGNLAHPAASDAHAGHREREVDDRAVEAHQSETGWA